MGSVLISAWISYVETRELSTADHVGERKVSRRAYTSPDRSEGILLFQQARYPCWTSALALWLLLGSCAGAVRGL